MGDGKRTQGVWLVNAKGDYARHDFHGTEVVPFSGLDGGDGERAVALLYRCRDTGAVRRWGMETLAHHGLHERREGN